MMKLDLAFFLFLNTILYLITGCNSVEPPPGEQPVLTLKLEDASCTEAWIQQTTNNFQLPAEINLKRTDANGNSKDVILYVSTADTLLYIDSLLPNQTYSFTASHSGLSGISSNELNVTTMDTTSHAFTFETFTFGGTAGSSTLYDVAIIDENNIWAVGEIYVADTSQNGYTMYNAVHWDGSEWELKQVYFPTVCGSSNLTTYPASSVFAFDDGQIWISSSGDKIAIFQGGVQVNKFCLPWSFSINKIWGSSSDDLYIVGNNGNIAHYLNGQWSRIESGTELHVSDIWGQKTINGNYEILCVASDYSQWLGTKVLEITNDNVLEIDNGGLPQSQLFAVWFIPERIYFVAGDGFYSVKKLGERWIKNITMPPYSKTGISGNGFNDIVVSGAYGLLMHFNGFSWKTFFNMPYLSGSFGEVKIKEDLIISTGGLNNGQAIITIGRR